ncbi:MAG: hypothetical protein ACPGRE_08680 [Flavobacteriaceae bacterium]
MNKSVSILGLGWLGMPLAQEFYSKGFEVLGSRRAEVEDLLFKTFVVDLSEISEVEASFFEVDTFIIALPSKDLEGYQNLIARLKGSLSLKQVVLMSTTSVYASLNTTVDEDSELNDSVRVDIESLFKQAFPERLCVLRLGGLIGYSRQPGNFFQGGRSIPQPDGYVNLVHRDDVIQSTLKLVEASAIGCYNIVARAHPGRGVFYHNQQEKLGNAPSPLQREDVLKYKIVSSERIRSEFDVVFRYDDLIEFP